MASCASLLAASRPRASCCKCWLLWALCWTATCRPSKASWLPHCGPAWRCRSNLLAFNGWSLQPRPPLLSAQTDLPHILTTPRSAATHADLERNDFLTLLDYSSLLFSLCEVFDEYASVRQHLAQHAGSAQVATQLLLRGLAAGTAALREGTQQAWRLLDQCLTVLHHLSVGQSAAQRMLSSSLPSSGGGLPRLMPQLLAEAVAALPRKLPSGPAGESCPHETCLNAAGLMADLYVLTAQSAPVGSHPAAQLRPADWQALASLPRLAPLLHQIAAGAARLGDSRLQLRCSQTADAALGALYLLFPTGTTCSDPEQLALWCKLARSSWLLLATAAAVPQLPAERQSATADLALRINSSFVMAAGAWLPLPGTAAASRGSSRPPEASCANSLSCDAVLPPLLQLSRRLCRAAHFLSQSDPSSHVAAAMLHSLMPRFVVSASQIALGVLANLGGFR